MTTGPTAQTLPPGRMWLANYQLNVAVGDRSWAIARSDDVSVRIRRATTGFAVLLGDAAGASEFVADHASAVSLVRFVHLTLPEGGDESVHGAPPPWPDAVQATLAVLAPPIRTVSATTWEYRSLKRSTMNMDGLLEELNQLGDQGWELVNFDTADRTLGTNAYVALLRRPTGTIELSARSDGR